MNPLLAFAILSVFSNGVYARGSSEIDTMLKSLNKPAVKTIKSQDGDIIDCVDIYKQPAFDHPALKNHKIQMKPSVKLVPEQPRSRKTNTSKPIVSQIWTKAGSCPEGTVPIRRVRREDITRTSSSGTRFGRKTPYEYRFLDKSGKKPANFSLLADRLQSSPENRSEAFVITLGYNYIGSKADINVWNPSVQPGDYSSSQIWMVNGPRDSAESIEAGWLVNPGIFGDSRTRLFGYWTKDGYKTTGCFNVLCPGFVQTSTKVSLGAAIEPVSGTSGQQYQITIAIFKDPNTGNWWMHSGDEVVGYWPGSLFSYLSHSAIAVQWGGQVYSPNVRKTPHTKTAMGSGDWADGLWSNAAFHTNIRIQDYSLQLKYPETLSEYADEYDCYTTKLYRETYMTEPLFYFGGPGQNPRCP